jgi:hypothetical protein
VDALWVSCELPKKSADYLRTGAGANPSQPATPVDDSVDKLWAACGLTVNDARIDRIPGRQSLARRWALLPAPQPLQYEA